MDQSIQGLMKFLKRSVSPYHGVAATIEILKAEGFEELSMYGKWRILPQGKYYVNCRGSMAIAFTVGKTFSPRGGFRIAACHMDWPCFYIKPDPEIISGGCLKLTVEPYGGQIYRTWMDRPLSCAGLVTLKGADPMEPEQRLFDFGRPLFTIPSLAIHMDREVNKGAALDPAKELMPLADTVEKAFNKDDYFLGQLAKAMGVNKEDILFFDLVLYNAEEPQLLGFEQELLSSPRLDNLTSAFACLAGITGPQRSHGINMAAFFDNEEIGSHTKTGADSNTFPFLIEKLAGALNLQRADYLEALMSGFLLSCDVGHAFHPNYPEKYDPKVYSVMNGGVIIKMNYEQRYATDAVGVGVIEGLCRQQNIPYQRFMNRAGIRGGSTLGAFGASYLSMRAADVGVPILAMHASRELMGARDQQALNDLVSALFREE